MNAHRIAALALTLMLGGCFIDNPGLAPRADGGSSDGGSVADAGPSTCTIHGGYTTIEKVVADLVTTLGADCRIGPFFTTLDAEDHAHFNDCMVKQVAVLTKCPGIRYDVDNAGEECRDMAEAHYGLGIREDDFNAFIDDVATTLATDGFTQAEIDAVSPALFSLHDDIVSNSAPGAARSICDASAQGDGG